MNTRIFLLVFLFSSLLHSGCKESSSSQSFTTDPFISYHSQGIIRSGDPVVIRLNTSNPSFHENLSSLPDGIVSVQPGIKLTTRLREGGIIECVPTEGWKNGQTYHISLQLEPLFKDAGKQHSLRFPVKIIPQVFAFETGTLEVGDDESRYFQYRGTLQAADAAAPESFEKKVVALLNGKSLPVEWTHQANQHHFLIRNIERKNESQTLVLTFASDVENGGEQQVVLPGKNQFSVLDIRARADESRSIDITLSDYPDASQDLRGLITAEGIQRLQYEIRGNSLRLYSDRPDEISGSVQVTLHRGIRSRLGEQLLADVTRLVQFPSTRPEVAFIGKGSIAPGGETLIPFSAVGLQAVRLQVIQVFEQNMIFFLQDNSYGPVGYYDTPARTGKTVANVVIPLLREGETFEPTRRKDYKLNLADYLPLKRGNYYQVRLLFDRSFTDYATEIEASAFLQGDSPGPNGFAGSHYYPLSDEYIAEYPADYDWKERNNPASSSYYIPNRFPRRAVVVTDLAITAKSGTDGRFVVAVNDIASARAVSGCRLYFYNYQNQLIDSAQTDRQGLARVQPPGKTFVILAVNGSDRAYLKVSDGTALSLSNFDVSGGTVQKGLKGYIYGERDVWRTGNPIHLSFMLEDKEHLIPEGHPILAELYDPSGNLTQTRKEVRGSGGLYYFPFSTQDDAVTGHWQAVVRIGGATFTKRIRIETIKPNRLSILAEFPDDILGIGTGIKRIPVKTRWLHGAPTPGLKAKTELELRPGKTRFTGFADYLFDDHSKTYPRSTVVLFDGHTDSQGNFTLDLDSIKKSDAIPGMLQGVLTLRVFEKSGDFSTVTSTFTYSPFTEYVGLRLPDSDDRWYSVRKPISVRGAVLSTAGKPVEGRKINIELYRLEWRWWWDAEYDHIASYVNRAYRKPVSEQTVVSRNGRFSVDITCPEHGRYYLIARDPESGHTCGTILYASSWGEGNEIAGMASLLTLSSDQQQYTAGDSIRIRFPSSAGGVALVSIENGKTVQDIFRIPTQAGTTTFRTVASQEMCPNVFVHVSLLQPHHDRDNDRPIRLYGVLNIPVEDPALHLTPQIDIPKELRPSAPFTVTVSEKEGKPMNYTLAVVDEGLLAITSFKTPDPFPVFYAREALGVKTWDFYDEIFGAYGGRLEKAFAVGGDETLETREESKSDRFTPVVLFQGPFSLLPGEKRSHTLSMPDYIGEVRTMVVAEQDGKYGSASTHATVTQPLMLHITLPRLLTPGDEMEIPVTLFTQNASIRSAEVFLRTDNKMEIIGSNRQTVKTESSGEEILFFRVRILSETGMSTLRAEATGGGERAHYACDTEVRLPNPPVTEIRHQLLEADQSLKIAEKITGLQPEATLEISSIPALNLAWRIDYLTRYPHGCAEQITSAALAQLRLHTLIELTAEEKNTIERNVGGVIDRLLSYRHTEGGITAWQGYDQVSEWVSAYVAEFLLRAEREGYRVPPTFTSSLLQYLNGKANNWRGGSEGFGQLEQAYRLYVLALAGQPNLPAMNRMKERADIRPVARWQLAGAYALCNHRQIARALSSGLPREIAAYRQPGGGYGSSLRDNAILLQCMTEMDMQDEGYRLLESIATRFSSGDWLSTQECAFGINAACSYVRRYLPEQTGIRISLNDKEIVTSKTIVSEQLPIRNKGVEATLTNRTAGRLHVRTIIRSTPTEVVTTATQSGLQLSVDYRKNNLPAPSTSFVQGDEITVVVTVTHAGHTGAYQNLALSYLFPSGFEFYNERLTTGKSPFTNCDHADIRDDRLYLYFDLKQGEKKEFVFRFNAAYPGVFLVPAITCDAMYDQSIRAVWPGSRITIER